MTCAVLDKVYQFKRHAGERFLNTYPIVFDELLPDWNDTAIPTDY